MGIMQSFCIEFENSRLLVGSALFLVHVGDSTSSLTSPQLGSSVGPILANTETANRVDNTSANSVWIAINKNGIDVLSYPDFVWRTLCPSFLYKKLTLIQKALRSIPIKQVAGWGYSADCFNVTVGSLRKPVRLSFLSPEVCRTFEMISFAYLFFLHIFFRTSFFAYPFSHIFIAQLS